LARVLRSYEHFVPPNVKEALFSSKTKASFSTRLKLLTGDIAGCRQAVKTGAFARADTLRVLGGNALIHITIEHTVVVRLVAHRMQIGATDGRRDGI
jgi:hypothetical protein